MKVYFAFSHAVNYEFNKFFYKCKNVLLSYYAISLFKKINYADKKEVSTFLDSGAFSALTKSVDINIDEYVEYIKQNLEYYDVYANLDVIGDWKATKKNQEYMESKGLNPIPTFHYNSPLSELVRLCSKYDYIALGGLVPLSLRRKLMVSWLNKCWEVIFNETVKKGEALTKVHGFGVNSFFIWNKYPFYSVDASSWRSGGRYRRTVKFEVDRIVAYGKSSKMGLDTLRCFTDSHTNLDIQNAEEYTKAAEYITKVWEKRGIKFD